MAKKYDEKTVSELLAAIGKLNRYALQSHLAREVNIATALGKPGMAHLIAVIEAAEKMEPETDS